MATTETRSKSIAFGQSWRELANTPLHLVPVLLGGFLALAIGVLTYVFDAVNASALVAVTPMEAYMVLFGIVGMIGYSVSKRNVQNGSLIAAIAGLVLVTVVTGTTVGLVTGLLLLFGAIWSLASSR